MLTPEQIAKIRQKEASTPEALQRYTMKDHLEGLFFVTLNTRYEVPVLSTVVGNAASKDGTGDAPQHPTSAVKSAW